MRPATISFRLAFFIMTIWAFTRTRIKKFLGG